MKILVFDDSADHRRSAIALLEGHELTVVETYDEAEKALRLVVDRERVKQAMKAQFGVESPWDLPEEKREAYWDADRKATADATTYPDFDVVLTDLLVPASNNQQGREGYRFVGQEMPLGTVIAIRALAAGIKRVAIITDMNHHNHPASAAFDHLKGFSIGDVRLMCDNDNVTTRFDVRALKRVSEDFLNSDEGKAKYTEMADGSHQGVVWAKDWARALEKLMA
ncbi:MAG: hypothetical protein AAB638_00350 [Patescibacteria group bacterium]